MTFGEKLRKLRVSLGMTQEEVAIRADLARSFISQVETDKTSPTLDNLERILKAVGTTLKAFFSDEKEEKVIYRKDEGVPLYDQPSGIRSTLLMNEVENKKIDAVFITLKPGSRTVEEDYHSGDEYGYVLTGTIHLVLDGVDHVCEKGDSFYYRSDKKHFIMNEDPTVRAKCLWIKID
jgi:transcriptional regulator with XRE-family HTH domain